ncbi:MAG: preprotein translocase subunit SecE, partial [Bryobacteraceae bacterium]
NYFEELHLEMKRVTWPPWKQVRATTAVVIVAVFAFAGYFAVVDAIFGRAIQKLFDTFTK